MSDYDVIIIGTGAGGGTLARHLAPVGQARSCCSSGATGSRASRRTGPPPTSSSTTATSPPTRGTTPTARRSSRRSTTSSAAPPSSTARRCTGCARRTSASCSTTTASRPPGRSPTTRWSPTTPRPSSCTRCTAPGARTRPSRRRARPTRSRRVSHEPRIQQLSDDLAAAGHHPFHAPCGVMLNEAEPAVQPLRPLRDLRRLPVPGPRQVRRRGARRPAGAGASQRHAAHQRPGGPAGDQRRRHGGHRGRRRPRRRPGALHRATSSSSPAARPTRPSCCSPRPATSTPTAWPTAPTRSGATTCSTTARPCWPCRGSRTRPCSRRRSGVNDFYFASDDFDYPMGNIQMIGKSQADMFRGEKPLETKLAPDLGAARRRRARGRLLAVHRGPARCRTTGSRSSATATSS